MKLSRSIGYALQATACLAALPSDEPVSCRRLAESEGLPERFLLQILRNLVTHSVLRSTRGVDGGYALNRPADRISLLDIIEAIEGPLHFELPDVGEAPPPHIRRALERMTQRVRSELGSLSLADLVRQHV